MTLKKKEEVTETVGKVENTPDTVEPLDEAKDFNITVLFKNGAVLHKKVHTTSANVNEIGQTVANCMSNPSLHGSITMAGTIFDLSEVVYFTVEE